LLGNSLLVYKLLSRGTFKYETGAAVSTRLLMVAGNDEKPLFESKFEVGALIEAAAAATWSCVGFRLANWVEWNPVGIDCWDGSVASPFSCAIAT